MKEEIIPDGIEPTEVWRSWRFDGTYLRSHNGTVWFPGEELHARCGYGLHNTAPEESCHCGIYGLRENLFSIPPGEVYGKVKLWGKIIPGTYGSRAEFAYPSELHVSPELANNPRIVAYGVPIFADANKFKSESFITGGSVVPSVLSNRFAAQTAMASSLFQSYPPPKRKLQWDSFIFAVCFTAIIIIYNFVILVRSWH